LLAADPEQVENSGGVPPHRGGFARARRAVGGGGDGGLSLPHAVYWRSTPDTVHALPQVTGLVDDQHPAVVAERVDAVAAQIIAHRVGSGGH
jgi:hypothetical protein